VSLPISREEVIEGVRRGDTDEGWDIVRGWGWDRLAEQIVAVREGREIVDADGVPL